MHSDFAAARLFLERASVVLRGDDEVSLQAREALGLLIEACACREAGPWVTKAPMPTRRTSRTSRRGVETCIDVNAWPGIGRRAVIASLTTIFWK